MGIHGLFSDHVVYFVEKMLPLFRFVLCHVQHHGLLQSKSVYSPW